MKVTHRMPRSAVPGERGRKKPVIQGHCQQQKANMRVALADKDSGNYKGVAGKPALGTGLANGTAGRQG